MLVLVDNATNRRRIAPALDAVEYNLRYRSLASFRFTAGLEINSFIKAALLNCGPVQFDNSEVIRIGATAPDNIGVWRGFLYRRRCEIR